MDPSMYVAYAPQTNGLPLESKLATYMNRQAPGMTLNAANVTKHLANLSLDSAKKVVANIGPELLPGRINSNSTSPNIFNNSYHHSQENVGGTTYFYVQNPIVDHGLSVVEGEAEEVELQQLAYVYPGTQTYLQPMKDASKTVVPKINSNSNSSHSVNNSIPETQRIQGGPQESASPPPLQSYFVSDLIKQEILQKNILALAPPDPVRFPDIPVEVEHYHDLVLLDDERKKRNITGYMETTYKATNSKNGIKYCLRRIHEFQLTNKQCLGYVELWKRLTHTNIVQLREFFFTKAFGDDSAVFVYDYHPGSETMMKRYFPKNENNGYSDPFSPDAPRPYSHTKNTLLRNQHNSTLLPESVIWNYIIQLTSALRVIHQSGIAYKILDPTKVLLTSRSTRLRLTCTAVADVLFDLPTSNPVNITMQAQQEDLLALGKLVLALACRSPLAVRGDNMTASLELVARTYSSDLRNFILYLFSNQIRKSVTDLMPMIGARFYTQLDLVQNRLDVIETELSKELDNGRLFRLIAKLSTINERAELNLDPQWSETGDRYMLKLFRDYVFHQLNPDGRPWIDLAHVVSCLNKLDVGAPDKICLVSRDEQTVLIVTYAELRDCLESSFNELIQTAKGSSTEAV